MPDSPVNMAAVIIQTLGGLGLFLLGMVILTDSLRSLTGDVMRRMLLRFTHTPLTGAMTGTVMTAILQSSSATTVAAVGLVGAGSMGFAEALGIVFGANIGTTMTGWLVVLLGFKLQVGVVLLPLILVGVLFRLFARGRASVIGMAIAGFGVIFVGIYVMQQGAAPLQQWLTPESFPADSVRSRLGLFLAGMLFSAITQSSSAGVALSLTALHAGAISFPQAAALVVGMDVGTTVTTALATIGTTVNARRTGLSHVIYNCFTGTGALLLISPYMLLWHAVAPGQLDSHAEIALITFHTSFNTLGVIIVLPLTRQFAALVERMIPHTAPVYTRGLDRKLLQDAPSALNAAAAALRAESLALMRHLVFVLGDNSRGSFGNLVELKNELLKTAAFVDAIELHDADSQRHAQLVSLFHAMDHAQRLHDRCFEGGSRLDTAARMLELEQDRDTIILDLLAIIDDVESENHLVAAERGVALAATIGGRAGELRNQVMTSVARNAISVDEGTRRLEAIRSVDRICEHAARLAHHLSMATTTPAIGQG
ncbi:MAG: Na/Pi symporter [Gammaproteobacteria bacterium]|nr:Na/Pi symporter [Gammaproteobacteria bacterium]